MYRRRFLTLSCSGLLVGVVGNILPADAGPSRPFTHSFLLQPQCNGFFVASDIFRFARGCVGAEGSCKRG